MFVVDLWDSPLSLLLELALSIAVVVGIMLVGRYANKRGEQARLTQQNQAKHDNASKTSRTPE